MKKWTPENLPAVTPASEALLMPLYRCISCGENVMVHRLRYEDAKRWKDGTLIQKVWPNMTPDERERIILRACAECYVEKWAQVFEDTCEYCGGPATEDNPVNETSITPPTADHPAEMVHAHAQCASEWALGSV